MRQHILQWAHEKNHQIELKHDFEVSTDNIQF